MRCIPRELGINPWMPLARRVVPSSVDRSWERWGVRGGSKAGFRSLGDAWADTTTAHGRLILTVLGGLAEFERDLIRTRTGEGRARAIARGQKMGRPPKLTPHQQREAIKRRSRGEESLADIGRSYNVSGATISRLP